jgi:hypothetical protein
MAYETHHRNYLRDVALRFPILLYGELNKCFVSMTELDISFASTVVFTVIFSCGLRHYCSHVRKQRNVDIKKVSDNTHKIQ